MDTSSIINRLGGTKKAAEICGVSLPAVTYWRTVGIPPKHWPAIVAHAKEHGIDGVTFDAIETARRAAPSGAAAN
jgi:hypothetical protein